MRQRTIKESIRATGIGLHSGEKVYMTIRPAPQNTGIVFRRIDLDDPVDIQAKANNVSQTTLGTTIEYKNAKVATVEHLLSAMAGLGIDNAFVELTAAEVPIMDGSAAPFVFLLQSAGIEKQKAKKKFIKIKKFIEVKDGDKVASLSPYDGFRLNMEIDFEHPVFKMNSQSVMIDFSVTSFLKEISRARTFGFLRDLEILREKDLTLGGGMDNAIVMDEFRVLNEDGLRFRDEFVRHKTLDAIGDLYLMGASLIGKFVGYKSGHNLNNLLLRKVLSSPDSYEEVVFDNEVDLPASYRLIPSIPD
ncbi:MAG: UDP-3-O-[3-hydroxymyristoyl] N-acetylglucosamine deacetylase [Gammaproteobacteria bacterium TMED78]|nr:MAG: UDP-3-O-[3-hydroxymyristoyl] N-acetylglucosamine deacetylase [Gammaproteobacteria bacterium TMED78]